MKTGMGSLVCAGLGAVMLAGCTSSGLTEMPGLGGLTAPTSAQDALDEYYDTVPASSLPVAPPGVSLPADQTALTRILVGSCNDEEAESPALARIAREDADLFLMIGDNVYGDRDGRAYAVNDPELEELRRSFADLASREEFRAVRSAHPMMVVWDDHDYGANDAGRDFAFKAYAERIHETFWGLDGEDVGAWPGTYYARSFGPVGQRTQIIMLDTRFFRSDLTDTDAFNQKGKERYMPAPAGSPQDMLGAAQWTWLENQLSEPADLRLIVSSIQVLPEAHGWESWNKLPDERARLFGLINRTKANGVVFVSGDRHSAFLYEDEAALDYKVSEITASSLNVAFLESTDEVDPRQLDAGFTRENFGSIAIDWTQGQVALEIHDAEGNTVRRATTSFRQ